VNHGARIFRNVLAQLCRSRGVPFRDVLDQFNVEEVLDGNWLTDQGLVSAILWHCCCTDGKLNNASIVFLAVMQFLKERFEDIGTQPFVELGQMLKVGTTETAVAQWVETHYPV
jgi:hypothetical protein